MSNKELIKSISKVLFDFDLMNLKSPDLDEYLCEAELIVLNCEELNSFEKTLDKVYSAFCNSFNYYSDFKSEKTIYYDNMAGKKDKYIDVSKTIFNLIYSSRS